MLNSSCGMTYAPPMLRHSCLCLLGLALFSATAPASLPASTPSAFGPGEHTVYQVRYLGISAGLADLSVGSTMLRDGHEVWPIVCVGKTTSFASIYRVNDRFISYWDASAQQNVGSDFFVEENRKKRRERYQYDREASKVRSVKQREGKESVERDHDVRADAVDLAAAGFWLRNVPLEIGAQHERAVFTGSKQFVMHAEVEARESLTTPIGTFDVFRVAVNAEFNGGVATNKKIRVYYTADAKQLPVRAEAEFAVGSVVAEVIQYEPGAAQ